jgi:hypothetical protein
VSLSDYFVIMVMPTLVSAAVIAFVPRPGRWFMLVAGLLLLATGLLPFTSGGHNPLGLIPFLGLGLVAGALLVETAVFISGRVKRMRAPD